MCDCGRRLLSPEAEMCWRCRRLPQAIPGKGHAGHRVCKCGVSIRSLEELECWRCRRKPDSSDVAFKGGWVRRGGILYPERDGLSA